MVIGVIVLVVPGAPMMPGPAKLAVPLLKLLLIQFGAAAMVRRIETGKPSRSRPKSSAVNRISGFAATTRKTVCVWRRELVTYWSTNTLVMVMKCPSNESNLPGTKVILSTPGRRAWLTNALVVGGVPAGEPSGGGMVVLVVPPTKLSVL